VSFPCPCPPPLPPGGQTLLERSDFLRASFARPQQNQKLKRSFCKAFRNFSQKVAENFAIFGTKLHKILKKCTKIAKKVHFFAKKFA